jgi:uncharacterized membrane protein YedE/YeeE
MKNLKFLLIGTMFGIVITKSEVISWFRIQEMFRFQAFHMYGVIGSAIIIGLIGIQILKRLNAKSVSGEPIKYPKKEFTKGTWIGGSLFGMGWALTGACPGPLFALMGSGVLAISVVILSALAGTWMYGFLKPRLPH